MKLDLFQEKKKHFLHHLSKHLKSWHTQRAYTLDLNQFEQFWMTLNTKKNKNFSIKSACTAYVASLYDENRSKKTVARKQSSINALVIYTREHGTPVDITINRPYIQAEPTEFLLQSEITHLLDKVREDEMPTPYPLRDKLIVELLYATGIKCSELIHIAFHDIHLENRCISISGSKKRTVFFGMPAKQRIEAYCMHERSEPKSGQEYLLLNYDNKPLTTRSIQRICNMFATFLPEKKPVTPQVLRHSFALHLLQQGADKKSIQELLGYTSLISIEKYCKILENMMI
jgi:site-specific recombinase XerD